MKKEPVLGRIVQSLAPYRLTLLLALISGIMYVVLTLWAPVVIGWAVDLLLGAGLVQFGGVVRYLLLLGAMIGLAALFQWAMTLCTNHITFHTVHSLRARMAEKLQRVPLKTIDNHAHGDLIARMTTDIDTVSDGLLQGFAQLFTGVLTILGTLGFMLSINATIALVVVLVTPLSLFVSSFIARRSYHLFHEQSALRGAMTGLVEEMIGHQKIVKAFGREEASQKSFDEINEKLYACGVKAQFFSSLTNPCTRFVNAMVYASVGLCGAFVAMHGGVTVGQLSSFLSYANQYTKPFNEISGVITELQNALASARRVFAFLEEEEQRPEPEDACTVHSSHGQLTLEHVCFSYQKDRPLLKDLCLKAQPGARIAIVGPTGCGKTTLINLLMRFYELDSGRILIDGTDQQTLTRNSVRGLYGMVLQDSWLFCGSVLQNIAYGKPDATREEVIRAAQRAHADGFIRRLPGGYDAPVGDDGSNLSQGQKQLLCIARILLTNPSMLILDEATSSIDTRTELAIQQAFDEMMRGRTSFIVAHRLSTIQKADCILVMRDGEVIERGTHETLLAQNGFYTQLYNSQFAAPALHKA
ncbi:MAG: ABC transporter ATP-binding protein [Clostridiales bacterium]|nr:ABC transporter ATP-binding protein [Clostridiales bacterium]